jgi:hypothetical protein
MVKWYAQIDDAGIEFKIREKEPEADTEAETDAESVPEEQTA